MNMRVFVLLAMMSLIMLSCFSAGCVEQTPSQNDILADVISSLHETLTTTADEARSTAYLYYRPDSGERPSGSGDPVSEDNTDP